MSDSDSSDFPTPWKCPDCGHSFYCSDEWDEWYCSECGSEMVVSHPEGYMPIEALEELVGEWRETPEYLKLHRGKSEAADELQEIIENHE